MAKNCPNCGLENPSIAKFCMGCNTQLVEENQLSEEDKLRIQNADLREQVQELKKQKKTLEKAYADLILSYNALKKENLLRSHNILKKEPEEAKQIISNETPNKKNEDKSRQIGPGCWIFFWLFVAIITLLMITKKI